MKYNIIIAGGRDFNNYSVAITAFKNFIISKKTRTKPTIICGMAKGADMVGYDIAETHGLKIEKFFADWDKYGDAAGPIRNEEMAKYAAEKGNGVLLAFWDGESKGTKSMINYAKKYKLEVHVFNYEGDEICTN